MSLGKGSIIAGVSIGIVVVGAATGGAILAVNMPSNNVSSATKIEEKVKLNGWQQKNGNWYYYKDDAAKTGWIQDNNNWYYLDDSGKMKLNWVQDKNKWFYLGSDGKMRTGWIQDQGKWYYINSDGTMAANTTIDGCYLNENGIIIDTPAKKEKQAETKGELNSNVENVGNSLTRNEAINLIYNNDGKNIMKEKIKLEYYGVYTKDQMITMFKKYPGASINEDAYVVLAIFTTEDIDPRHYLVGKESGRVFFEPSAGMMYEIENDTIIHKYKMKGYS